MATSLAKYYADIAVKWRPMEPAEYAAHIVEQRAAGEVCGRVKYIKDGIEETGRVSGIKDSVAYICVETRNGKPVDDVDHDSSEECNCTYTPVPLADLTIV